MILSMAWRNIWRNKMRSIVIILSIAVGLFAGIAVLALYKGMMTSRIRTVIDAEVSHLQVHDTSFKKDYESRFIIKNGDSLLRSITGISQIRLAVPRSVTTGMLSTATGSAGVQINGVIPDLEYQVSQLNKKVREGRLFDVSRRNEVMVGKKLAVKLKLRPGSKLVLTLTDTSGSIVSGAFRVASIYQSDNAPLDERNVYVKLNELNTLLGSGNTFHEIAILLKNDNDVKMVQQQLRNIFPSYQVETWREISPETDLLVRTTDQYSYIIIIIIMLALAFGIINTMLMAILERTREIGMMVALGTNRIRIFFLVLLETVFLTLVGTPFGILIGWLTTAYFEKHGLDLSGMGREMMSSFGFDTMVYPEFPVDKLGGVLIIVSATAIVSCLFPAMKALKLQPVEALRR